MRRWRGRCRGCCSLCDTTDRRLMGRCCSRRNILIGLPWLYFPSCLGHLSGTVGFCWRCTEQNLLFSVLERKVSELTEAIYCSSSAAFWVQDCCCQIPFMRSQTIQINMLKSEFLCCIETGSVTSRNEQIWCISFSCVATEGYSNQLGYQRTALQPWKSFPEVPNLWDTNWQKSRAPPRRPLSARPRLTSSWEEAEEKMSW